MAKVMLLVRIQVVSHMTRKGKAGALGEQTSNKAFKWDSCRVAFLACGDFCGESGLRKFGLCGIHPLTRRY
ncbi:hypothetical protein ACSTEN_22280, partial [Vibrio vulnificus]